MSVYLKHRTFYLPDVLEQTEERFLAFLWVWVSKRGRYRPLSKIWRFYNDKTYLDVRGVDTGGQLRSSILELLGEMISSISVPQNIIFISKSVCRWCSEGSFQTIWIWSGYSSFCRDETSRLRSGAKEGRGLWTFHQIQRSTRGSITRHSSPGWFALLQYVTIWPFTD